MTMQNKIINTLKDLGACDDFIEYMLGFDTFEEAWESCERGDWMLWLAQRLHVDIRLLTKAKALCALTVRRLMKNELSIDACYTALKFSEGVATMGELCAASHIFAYSVADASAYADVYAAYAAKAAKAAAYAAVYPHCDAGLAAAFAAAAAAYPAASATYAAHTGAGAKKKNMLDTSKICREVLTYAVTSKIKAIQLWNHRNQKRKY